jgi:hypothetical protein
MDAVTVLYLTAVLWIRIQSDPELFAGSGSGVGSGINHFGSGKGSSQFTYGNPTKIGPRRSTIYFLSLPVCLHSYALPSSIRSLIASEKHSPQCSGSRMGEKSISRSGIWVKIPEHISESLETIFRVKKYMNFLVSI